MTIRSCLLKIDFRVCTSGRGQPCGHFTAAPGKNKNRLIEIASDGVIHDDQIKDFVSIRDQLRHIASIAGFLTMWFDDTVENGNVNREILRPVLTELEGSAKLR